MRLGNAKMFLSYFVPKNLGCLEILEEKAPLCVPQVLMLGVQILQEYVFIVI